MFCFLEVESGVNKSETNTFTHSRIFMITKAVVNTNQSMEAARKAVNKIIYFNEMEVKMNVFPQGAFIQSLRTPGLYDG